MKLFFHFLKSNILYNKVELAISFGVACFLCLAVTYWGLLDKHFLLMCVSYGGMYAYMSNKRKTSLKYLVSLPASKSTLILAKAAADGIYFFPSAILLIVCNYLYKAGFDLIPLVVLLFMLCMTFGILLLEQEVEEPRVENGKGSFLNRLIYVRKILDMFIVGGSGAVFLFAIYSIEIPMSAKQYLMILIMSFVIFFNYRKCLKLMLDESLSYFIFKRDLVKTSLKLGVPMAILFLGGFSVPDFKSPYGSDGVYAYIKSGNVEQASAYIKKVGAKNVAKEKGDLNFTPMKAAIISGDLDMMKLFLEFSSFSNQEMKDIYGSFEFAKMAVKSGKTDVFDFGIKNLGLQLNSKDKKSLETLMHVASSRCSPAFIEYFSVKGAKINAQDSKGDTPLHLAAKGKCSGGVVLLLQAGADPMIKNKEGKSALEELKKIPSLEYYAQRFVKKEKGPARGLASESSLSP